MVVTEKPSETENKSPADFLPSFINLSCPWYLLTFAEKYLRQYNIIRLGRTEVCICEDEAWNSRSKCPPSVMMP